MKRVVQLWSYNYDPEPTGIGPVSTTLARSLVERDWDVEVVSAHPHYPEPAWGRVLYPYRETRDGIRITRLPLWIGRDTPRERIRQELTYASALSAALPFLAPPFRDRPSAVIAASPSFPALAPAVANSRLRRIPLILWLHDLLPDGASATNQIDEGGPTMRASRWLESTAYRAADRIVVLSRAFVDNLRSKSVPDSKVDLVYDPATRGVLPEPPRRPRNGEARILCMGNIGHSQGLAPLVRELERYAERNVLGAKLVITGSGVAAKDVAKEVRSDAVEMRGLVSEDELEQELLTAHLGLVTQASGGAEFNLPSKIMNYMGYGLPVLSVVHPAGEVAGLVRDAEAGWVINSADPGAFPGAVVRAIANQDELERRGHAAHRFARARFAPEAFGKRFDQVLTETCTEHRLS